VVKNIFTKTFIVILISLIFWQVEVVYSYKQEYESVCKESFLEDINYGERSERVLLLQSILNSFEDTKLSGGVESVNKELGFFGNQTFFAVKSFQEKYSKDILENFNDLSEGTGYVGPFTRKKLTDVCLGLFVTEKSSLDSGNDDGNDYINDNKDESVEENIATATTLHDDVEDHEKKHYLLIVGVLLLIVFGFNFIFWGFIGFIRYLTEVFRIKDKSTKNIIEKSDVAALVPAHDEELVIAKTVEELTKIFEVSNIHVVSDGSNDKTTKIARSFGVNVLELNPGKGKAGALEYAVKHFKIKDKFKALVIVDADTRLVGDYLENALPFFNDENVVAVAGYAKTMWHPDSLSWSQKLITLHRDRVYFLFQKFVKFGQTWKYMNVAHIVPGFASTYRTSVLDKINMNPKGLVIEDFNMTFEVHHKKLGRIAHNSKVVAYTQDPDNLGDYYKQIKRWHLGFWQTIKLHGVWSSKFWVFMFITLVESVVGSFVFLITPITLIVLLAFSDYFANINIFGFLNLNLLLFSLFFVWIADYFLSVIAAIFQKRSEYLIYGLFFIFLKFVDAVAFLLAIPRAFLVSSDGKWISPTRRKIQ